MSAMFHQPIRRLFFWALVITLVLFTQTIVQAAQVTLAWDPNVPTPDGYRVFQRVEGQNYDYSSPVWPGPGDDPVQTSCTLDNLADGESYYFVVRAYVGSDLSGDSNEILHTTGQAEPTVYFLTADAGVGGSIAPYSATVNAGGSQTFSITADENYQIEDVWVDGVSLGPVSTYTFAQVEADHVISAVFAVNTYVIEAIAEGNGTLSPDGSVTVAHGASQSYTMVPDSGHVVADVLVDGQSVGAVDYYTFGNVTTPHTIRAIFAARNYTIAATADANGTISPSGDIIATGGQSLSFTITPENGYRIADVVVDGVSMGAVGTYTLSDIDADHAITASFEADAYTIAASSGAGGYLSPAGLIPVAANSSHTFSATADEGYELDDLIVDGHSRGAMASYTFVQIDTDHTIEARFKLSNQAPNADAGPDQAVDEQSRVTLNGLNSGDLDDGIAAFEWRQVKGTTVVLSSTSEEMVTFVAPDVSASGEALEFELTVTDYSGAQASDRCIVNVTWINEPPIAKSGADQSVSEGRSVLLSAAGSVDPDDGIAGYQWRQAQGPEVILSDPSSPSPSFTAPDVGPQGAALVFELTVTDAGGLQDTDSCVVTVTWDNQEPLADAGPDQVVMAGDEVALDGSLSMDPEGLDLNYQWRQTFGPPVILTDATAVRPLFTVPMDGFHGAGLTFELTVTDSGGLQATDVCLVSVEAAQPSEDTTPPTLTIENPTGDEIVLFKRRTTISGSAYDDQQVVRVTWQNDRGGSGAATGTTQWQIKYVRLYRGYNTIAVTAFDAAGNQQTETVTIYLSKRRHR